ncbi:helix-turn-helix domain-containing protein [Undibacterium sp.]|jgi:putative transcriptional regulator|uniref:helix-turn-helix domain-containing protein n=1 Tax=Undibacterium sp. TaxID=1914977 RepID=UPI002CF3FE9B|nr:helix-turn-helix domain-containing protein [Undibacterium sp.]HTD06809.1 helix-turn-helix domain-containing protein [Undibacterium sp.]
MNKELFQKLVLSVKQAGAIERGEEKPSRVFNVTAKSKRPVRTAEPVVKKDVVLRVLRVDARKVREQTGLSQSDFAVVMNVSVKTLQNWEQHRREPTGPAEALLKIVSKAPEVALQALHS